MEDSGEEGDPQPGKVSLKQQSSASEERKDTCDLLTLEIIFIYLFFLKNQDLYYNYLHFYSCRKNLHLVIKVGWGMVILQSRNTADELWKNHRKHQLVNLILRPSSVPCPGVEWPGSSGCCRRHFGAAACSVGAPSL